MTEPVHFARGGDAGNSPFINFHIFAAFATRRVGRPANLEQVALEADQRRQRERQGEFAEWRPALARQFAKSHARALPIDRPFGAVN
jgi:hypothetical protein